MLDNLFWTRCFLRKSDGVCVRFRVRARDPIDDVPKAIVVGDLLGANAGWWGCVFIKEWNNQPTLPSTQEVGKESRAPLGLEESTCGPNLDMNPKAPIIFQARELQKAIRSSLSWGVRLATLAFEIRLGSDPEGFGKLLYGLFCSGG